MVEFSLSLEYLENLKSAVENMPSYRDNTCNIVINGTYIIELPIIVAASLSSTITKMIRNDPTQNKFPFSLDNASVNNKAFDKIRDVLVNNKSVLIDNDNEMKIFASFGLSFGNNEFVKP